MNPESDPAIAELGHVGIRCHDVARQLEFYTRTLGLTVTDHDEALGVWFLSARPDTEHHEILLATGRTAAADTQLIQQVSFRCDSLESVIGFFRRFRDEGVELDMVVSHGNAVGVYFFDPEGNRCEVYWQTGMQARQPFVEHIDLDTDTDELLARIRASVEKYGESGFTEPSYVEWTTSHNNPASSSTGAAQ
ncbi:VOC family protein [Nocardia exalbida]|uniref:VOC family protein n=1 Tax=Nocardia exalbida TaxID=290231 RepID=UPI000318FB1D|nr:VOC family protein [Nocardia exalbida]